jgi:hypothetical protein
MNKKIRNIFSGVLIGTSLGLVMTLFFNPIFHLLGHKQMHAAVIKHCVIGINRAKKAGVFNCCFKPGCTMCYMQGNKWNDHQPGTCACAGAVFSNKKPCPQCIRALGIEHE